MRIESLDAITEPDAVGRRFFRDLLIVIAVGVIAAAVLAGLRFTLGVCLGGLLALLNYKWLYSSLRAILAIGVDKSSPTRMKIIFRWLVIGGAAYLAVQTGWFDSVGIMAGLLAPAGAVFIEAGYILGMMLAHREA
jgi:hypothetical protein